MFLGRALQVLGAFQSGVQFLSVLFLKLFVGFLLLVRFLRFWLWVLGFVCLRFMLLVECWWMLCAFGVRQPHLGQGAKTEKEKYEMIGKRPFVQRIQVVPTGGCGEPRLKTLFGFGFPYKSLQSRLKDKSSAFVLRGNWKT